MPGLERSIASFRLAKSTRHLNGPKQAKSCLEGWERGVMALDVELRQKLEHGSAEWRQRTDALVAMAGRV